MSLKNGNATLSKLRKALVLQQEIADRVQELHAHDAATAIGLVRQLAAEFGIKADAPGAKKERVERGGGNYSAICEMFAKRNNQPVTKPEIAKLSGLTAAAVHSVLYTERPMSFQNSANPDGGRFKVWKLTDKAFEEVRAAT